jgi:aryl-alcohol dehydrogenase-like predicted oxidoreductase
VTGSDRWRALLTDEVYEVVERLATFAEEHGRELIDLAFAYLVARGAVASVIAGATTPEQVRRNVQAGAWELSEAQLAEVGGILDEAGVEVTR